jgi:uncharacterized protein (TIGR02266 family)
MELTPSAPPGSPEERRREKRVPTRIEVRFTDAVHAARVLHAYSLNFSLGGLCLRSRKAYAVGSPLALSLVVGAERLSLDAVVAWVRPSEGAVGLRFVDVADELRQRLATLMETRT